MKLWVAILISTGISLLMSWSLGFIVIPFMHKLKFGQTILDIGPSWHKKKQGTPTMGGIMFIIAFFVSLVAVLIIGNLSGVDLLADGASAPHDTVYIKVFAGIFMSLAFSLIGFADDYIKVKKKRNLGLTEKQKTVLQLIVIAVFLATVHHAGAAYTFIPYTGNNESKFIFWVLGFIAIYCTVNASNFTDGLDGLNAGVSACICVGFAVCSFILGFRGLSLICAALFGGLIGFLIWNKNPAKIIMGDVGSLFIGGLVCTFAYALNAPWLIILIAFVYVLEFASDIIQIAYSLTHRGKKLFKMAPIHHHYEQSGWSEKRICVVFCLITLLCSAAAVALCYFGRLK